MSISSLVNFTLKSPARIKILTFFYEAILCDSHYVFRGLARGVSVLNLAILKRSVFIIDFYYKTTARFKIRRLGVFFVAVVTVENEVAFRLRGDLQVWPSDYQAQSTQLTHRFLGPCSPVNFASATAHVCLLSMTSCAMCPLRIWLVSNVIHRRHLFKQLLYCDRNSAS